jgi:hypothetical protein
VFTGISRLVPFSFRQLSSKKFLPTRKWFISDIFKVILVQRTSGFRTRVWSKELGYTLVDPTFRSFVTPLVGLIKTQKINTQLILLHISPTPDSFMFLLCQRRNRKKVTPAYFWFEPALCLYAVAKATSNQDERD